MEELPASLRPAPPEQQDAVALPGVFGTQASGSSNKNRLPSIPVASSIMHEKMSITATTTNSNCNFFSVHTFFCSTSFHLSQKIEECLQKHKVVQLDLWCCQKVLIAACTTTSNHSYRSLHEGGNWNKLKVKDEPVLLGCW